jgi:hypothetical protein
MFSVLCIIKGYSYRDIKAILTSTVAECPDSRLRISVQNYLPDPANVFTHDCRGQTLMFGVTIGDMTMTVSPASAIASRDHISYLLGFLHIRNLPVCLTHLSVIIPLPFWV